MKKLLYAVRDDLTMEFNTPTAFNSEMEAFRAYSHSYETYKKSVEQNPATPPIFAETKTIFYVGEYEDGNIIPDKVELCKLSLSTERLKSLLAQYGYKGE